jgi:ABC-type Fe3+/spermidine/putrescine transport system ATPase subunit
VKSPSPARSDPASTDGRTPDQRIVLELREVTKRFGEVTAVDRLSFAVQAGEVFTLLGPSGCGKSTALRLVAGLEHPDDGQILLNDQVIAAGKDARFVPPEKRNMGMVFQSYAIWPHFTVFENVAFPLRLRRTPKAEIRQRVADTLEVVGLGGLESRPATALSGGQQQRVALARALVYSPDVLLLDEPLSNLDAKLREHMRLELRSIQQRLRISVLFVTHDQAEAMTLSDRVAVMNAGRFEQVGTPADVYERPATPFVRDFLGRAIILRGTARRDGNDVLLDLTGEQGRSLRLPPGANVSSPDGSTVAISCRPEDAVLEPLGQPALNRLPVVIEEVAYLGERIEYAVRTQGGRSFVVFGTRRERHEVGSALDLVIDTRDATVWAE